MVAASGSDSPSDFATDSTVNSGQSTKEAQSAKLKARLKNGRRIFSEVINRLKRGPKILPLYHMAAGSHGGDL